MNLQHLKYVIEIEKTGSISKASENLFMSQPNLSRAVKELEESLGILIFKRTPKGIDTTAKGKEFLGFAKGIISQMDEVEKYYKKEETNRQVFNISVPRANYIAHAFINFSKSLELDQNIEINYRETNNMRAIKNITNEEYSLGIVRFISSYHNYFDLFLESKDIESKFICKFKYQVLMSKDHPLANQELTAENLSNYIEVTHGDPFIPSLNAVDAKRIEFSEKINKRIYVYERGSQFDLLKGNTNTFMRVSGIPASKIELYGLIQKPCVSFDKEYQDFLIYPKKHTFSKIEEEFIKELEKSVSEMIDV